MPLGAYILTLCIHYVGVTRASIYVYLFIYLSIYTYIDIHAQMNHIL